MKTAELPTVKAGGTYSYHCALNGEMYVGLLGCNAVRMCIGARTDTTQQTDIVWADTRQGSKNQSPFL
jgi:hypothetical protein